MEMPDPSPLSGNCDVVNIWCGGNVSSTPAPAAMPAPAPMPSPSPVLTSEPMINSTPVLTPVPSTESVKLEIPKTPPVQTVDDTGPAEPLITPIDSPVQEATLTPQPVMETQQITALPDFANPVIGENGMVAPSTSAPLIDLTLDDEDDDDNSFD